MSNKASIEHVYEQLRQEGFVENPYRPMDDDQSNSPWFIQGLMGCGAWFAAIFLLASVLFCFFTTMDGLDQSTIGVFALIIGTIFIIVTTFVSRNDDSQNLMVSQFALVIHIVGHLLLFFGMVALFDPFGNTEESIINFQVSIILIVSIGLQVIAIWLYHNTLFRFIAMLGITACLAGIGYLYEFPILDALIVGILFIVAMVIWLDMLPIRIQIEQISTLRPVGFGAIVGASVLIIYTISNPYLFDSAPPRLQTALLLTGIILLGCLLWLEYHLLREYEIPITSSIALAIFVVSIVISLVVITTPGIIAGFVIVLLAFRRRNNILLGIGYAYLAGFIVYYYYWLDVTLLTKSVILMSVGVLLIIARFGLRRLTLVPDDKKGMSA